MTKKLLLAFLLLASSAFAQVTDTSSVPGTPTIGDTQIFDGTSFQFQPPPINGTSNVPRLISGCGVTYTTGLSFVVAPCNYSIGGVPFASVLTTVTLTAADGSNPRTDAVIVDNTGVATKVTGTPAATPASPSIDPTSQLQLITATVPANATVPFGVFLENVYLENTEWTCAASDGSNNCASTNNPFAGTKDIEGTTAARGDNVTLTRTSAITLSNFNNLSFYVRSKATWPGNCSLTWAFSLSGTQVGTGVVLSNGVYGFNSAQVASYQLGVAPITAFGSIGQVTKLTFTVTGAGSCSIGYYIDNIILQGGITTPSTVTGISPIVVSSNGVVSCPSCATTGISTATTGGVIGGGLTAATLMVPFGVSASSSRPPVPVAMNLSGPASCVSSTAVPGGTLAVWLGTVSPTATANRISDGQTVFSNLASTVECHQQLLKTFSVGPGEYLAGNNASLGTTNPTFWASSVTGTNSQPLGANIQGTVGIGLTGYTAPGQEVINTASENAIELVMPDSVDIVGMCITMSTSNGAGGNYVATLRKNEAATAMTFTVAASQGAGQTCDNAAAHKISYVAGDRISIQIVNNNAAAVTGTIQYVMLDARPTAAGMTGIMVYPKTGLSLTASQTRYLPAYTKTALNATEGAVSSPVPRPMTIKNLYCFQQTAPTNNATFKIYNSGVASTLVATATSGAGANAVFSDTTHSSVFTGFGTEWTSIEIITGAVTQVVSPGCMAGIY